MKKLLAAVFGVLGVGTPATIAEKTSTFFVFAKIQDKVLPIERGDKYEDPLDAALKEKKFGEVTGGGTQMAADKSVAWVGVDIELVNLGDALDFTKQKLKELGAPKGSVLEYHKGGEKITVPISE